jgi:DMSO/TMAO reductase YedYZ heme-binding membrane subunit
MQYVTRLLHVRPIEAGVESGFGAIVVEQGIIGLILWLVMTLAVVFSAWRVVRKLRGSVWFPLAFVIFWFSFLLFFPYTFGGIMAYEDFVLNAYLWLLLGILFRLPHLALSEKLVTASPVQG